MGRDDELDLVDTLLRSKSSSGVVLAGEAGVGKSRLATEALDRAVRLGYPTARILATRATSDIPLGAVAPLLRGAATDHPESVGILRWAVDEVAALGGEGRLALLVDDAHLLDSTSAALLLQLALERKAFVIVSVRTGEAVADAIRSLWKDDLAERLDLEPFSLRSVEQLLVAALEGPVDGATLERLHELSGGNALYLRELVQAALDAGSLAAPGGVWRVRGASVISPKLAELVDARLRDLAAADRDVLEFVAYGGPLSATLLERHFGRETLERLERLGLLVAESDGRRLELRLGHPIYGEVLQAETGELRARTIHRTLADWIIAAGARRRGDTLRIGTHLLAAGGSAPPGLMLQAAQDARLHEDLDLAERLAVAAVGAGAGFDASLLLAQLALLRGRPTDAERRFARLAEQAADDDQRVRVAYGRIDNLLVGLGRPDEAMRVAERTRAAMTDGAALDAMTSRLSSVLFVAGRTHDALVLLEPLFERAQDVALVETATIGGMCLAQAGRVEEALAIGERGQKALAELDGPPQTFGTHVALLGPMQALIFSGRLDEAEEIVGAEYRHATSAGESEAQASWSQMLAMIHQGRGRVMTSIRYASEAVALYRERRWGPHLRRSLAALVHGLALSGNVEAARAALDEMDSVESTSGIAFAKELEARAWVEITSGDTNAGARLLDEAVDVGFARGDLVFAEAALHALVRIGAEVERNAERLDRLRHLVQGPLIEVRTEHAFALATRDAAGSERASRRFEELGALLLAAEAASGTAVALRHAGAPRRAAGAERRAAQLARRCEGAMTPALRTIESQTLLTARELEVAGMAAAGLANREIAERLSLSVRTVETQLQRVYEKLGVHKRTELPDALEISHADT